MLPSRRGCAVLLVALTSLIGLLAGPASPSRAAATTAAATADTFSCEPFVSDPRPEVRGLNVYVVVQGQLTCNFQPAPAAMTVAVWPVAGPPTTRSQNFYNTFTPWLKVSRTCTTGWHAGSVRGEAYFNSRVVATASKSSPWVWIECG